MCIWLATNMTLSRTLSLFLLFFLHTVRGHCTCYSDDGGPAHPGPLLLPPLDVSCFLPRALPSRCLSARLALHFLTDAALPRPIFGYNCIGREEKALCSRLQALPHARIEEEGVAPDIFSMGIAGGFDRRSQNKGYINYTRIAAQDHSYAYDSSTYQDPTAHSMQKEADGAYKHRKVCKRGGQIN